jgi:hypothetical protein
MKKTMGEGGRKDRRSLIFDGQREAGQRVMRVAVFWRRELRLASSRMPMMWPPNGKWAAVFPSEALEITCSDLSDSVEREKKLRWFIREFW